MLKLKFILLFIISQISSTLPAKVLFIVPITTGSEFNFYWPIVNSLAKNGHELTLVTSKKSSSIASTVIQIEPFRYEDIFADFDNPFLMVERNEDLSMIFLDMDFCADLCNRVYESHEFQQKVLQEKFDLVIAPALVHQCFFGLAVKNNVSLILISFVPPPNYIVRPLGSYFPPSYIPYPSVPLSSKMNFLERTFNFLVDLYLQFYNEVSYIEKFQKIYRNYLPKGSEYPGVKEIIRNNISLVLVNSFDAINHNRPLLPDVIEVGGVHCQKANPLPPQLEEFVGIKNAPEGFIYFSFGSIIQGKTLPPNLREMFVRVFSRLKQKVLWKWEEEGGIRGSSENVLVSKWFPQQDVLGHPNIKFFMTHAGIFSSQEAMYHAVPLIAIPVYYDQFTNALQGVKQGYAVQLDIYNLKEDDLEAAIHEILTNKTYAERASYFSRVFQDQPQTPLERATYWIEYVLRHKGAHHLRSAARDLYWFQFHSLDVISVVLFAIGLVVSIFLYFIRLLIRSVTSSHSTKRKKE